MPVPSFIDDLDMVADNNSPPSGEVVGTNVDNYIRAHASFIAQLDASKLDASDIGTSIQAFDADIPTVSASQAEMQAGSETSVRSMSPLRVKQAIDALAPVQSLYTLSSSVAANALTVTLAAPVAIDFRSATVSSGSVNTRLVSSDISITIPSGATLGMQSGVESKIAILAIDNSGTVELAVRAAFGGADLNESGVITTQAISTSSDYGHIAYSTTARTNVPFRIVGYLVLTEATAGAYATAASEIIGVGFNGYMNAPLLARASGVASASRTVTDNTYRTVVWNTVDFDTDPSRVPGVLGGTFVIAGSGSDAPNGNIVLRRKGYWRISANIYYNPPQSGNEVSGYATILDAGTSGAGTSVIAVANDEFPQGEHPSMYVSRIVKNEDALHYYKVQTTYIATIPGTPATLDLQTSPEYIWCEVEYLGPLI